VVAVATRPDPLVSLVCRDLAFDPLWMGGWFSYHCPNIEDRSPLDGVSAVPAGG
jgi:hypothetical protein